MDDRQMVSKVLCFQLIRFEVIGELDESGLITNWKASTGFQLIRFEVIGEPIALQRNSRS